jgi:copper chaperone CopZ
MLLMILIPKVHEFEVAMTCEGCSGAVERNLNKIKGKFLPIKDCLDLIIANLERLPAITRIEDVEYTPTWLHIDSRNEKQLRIVRP